MNIKIVTAGLLALAFMLGACGGTKNITLNTFDADKVSIAAAPEANEGNPIPIDIVFAYSKETLADLEGFSASGWFSVKDTDLGNWQDSTSILSFTLQPGKRITINEFPEGHEKAVGIVVYANYRNKALNRLIFIETKDIDVTLTAYGMASDNGKVYFLTTPPEAPPQRQQARF